MVKKTSATKNFLTLNVFFLIISLLLYFLLSFIIIVYYYIIFPFIILRVFQVLESDKPNPQTDVAEIKYVAEQV